MRFVRHVVISPRTGIRLSTISGNVIGCVKSVANVLQMTISPLIERKYMLSSNLWIIKKHGEGRSSVFYTYQITEVEQRMNGGQLLNSCVDTVMGESLAQAAVRTLNADNHHSRRSSAPVGQASIVPLKGGTGRVREVRPRDGIGR